ncbi:MAG: hypothetical protein ACREQM_07735 [Candidatus Dormibacteraceae bacterium]
MGAYLVVANLTAESPSLRAEAAAIVDRDPKAEFLVLVPMRSISPLVALLGGLDGRALRRTRAARVRGRLESVGARHVRVRLGRDEPLAEIEHALAQETFDEVIISTLPRALSHWLRLDLPGRVARRYPGLSVRHVEAPEAFYVERGWEVGLARAETAQADAARSD